MNMNASTLIIIGLQNYSIFFLKKKHRRRKKCASVLCQI